MIIKKLVWIPISILIVILLVLSACSNSTTTSSQAAQSSATTSKLGTTSAQSTTTPTGVQPVYGGNMRIIAPSLVADLGYPPQMAPADSIQMQPILERLCYWLPDGTQTGQLAASWDIAPPSLTWHLRQGVKFTDGTDFDANVVKWNYQLQIDNKK